MQIICQLHNWHDITRAIRIEYLRIEYSKDSAGRGRSDARAEEKVKDWKMCLACNLDRVNDLAITKHSIETCEAWTYLSYAAQKYLIKCQKHPFVKIHTTTECKFEGYPWKHCSDKGHYFLLCLKSMVESTSCQPMSQCLQTCLHL